MKKVLSVRLENELYTKVYDHDLKPSDLIPKALSQYFGSKEPNKKLDVSFSSDSDYVNLLKQTLDEKNTYIDFLQKEVDHLTIMSMAKVPLLERIKMKLINSGNKVD